MRQSTVTEVSGNAVGRCWRLIILKKNYIIKLSDGDLSGSLCTWDGGQKYRVILTGAWKMSVLYLYVPANQIRDIVDCGIKLSQWYDRELDFGFPQGKRKVIRALINPWDDSEKSRDKAYCCIRLDMDPFQCQVGDSDLYQMGLFEPSMMERYMKTLVPLSDYRFGVFRNPECLVFTSILSDQIEVTGKVQDTPVLFENSESLYLSNLLDRFEQQHQDSGNTLVYAYCCYLEDDGRMRRVENRELGITVFIDPASDSYIVTKTP